MDNNKQNIIIYKTADGKASVALYAKDGNVWMNQNQLAELFATSKQNISLHIINILKEGELPEKSVVKDYLTTASDGKEYNITFYSLDMILAIGFRVRSKRGTQFRIWANKNLKEYMKKCFFIGVLTSVLLFSCSKEDDETTPDSKKEEITILTYTDIEFATADGSEEYGRFFVGSTGEILKDSEVTSENGPNIDLAYNQFSPTNTTGFFTSPGDLFDDFVIPEATTTQVVNYVTDELSIAQFDAMENDSLLNTIEIVDDGNANNMSGENIILFKTVDNLKGAIKTKMLNSDRLLVDIKIQKQIFSTQHLSIVFGKLKNVLQT